jgi:hypothetical protein
VNYRAAQSLAWILGLPWHIVAERRRIVDEWGYPKDAATEKVVAIDERGKEWEIPELGSLELDRGLRHYIVRAHNERLREEARRAVEAAKPKEYERLLDYQDLANVIFARKGEEDLTKELEKQGHAKSEAWEPAHTRLPPEDVRALETMAKKLNVSSALLYRAIILNAVKEILEKEKSAPSLSSGLDAVDAATAPSPTEVQPAPMGPQLEGALLT